MSGVWLASYIVLWILVLIALIALVAALRQIGILHEGTAAPSILRTKLERGERLPEIRLVKFGGEATSLSQVLSTRASILIISAGCSGCASLLKQLASGEFGERVLERILIVSVASPPDTERLLQQAGIPLDARILLDAESGVRHKWGIHAMPAAIHVDENLVILEQNLGFVNRTMIAGANTQPGNGHVHQSHAHHVKAEGGSHDVGAD